MASGLHTLRALQSYVQARRELLAAINCPRSCRDPLAEVAEWLVACHLNARRAKSRVQRGFDVVRPDGRRVQVKFLANPDSHVWINEHSISFSEEMDQYALVIFEAFELSAVLIFDRESLAAVCQRLGKRHSNQHCTLQFTRHNFLQIAKSSDEFANLGVTVLYPE